MTDTIEGLMVRIEADVDGLRGGLKEAVDAINEVGERTKENGESMTESFAKAEIAVDLLIEGLKLLKEVTLDLVKGGMDHVVQAERLAEVLGVDVKSLTELSFAAGESGVSMESLAQSIKLMERNLDNARTGTGKIADDLRILGLTATQLVDAGPVEAVKLIADALKNTADASERTRIMMDLFGRSGAQLIPIMLKGRDGFKEAADEANKLGQTFDTLDATKVVEAHKALEKVGLAFEGIGIKLSIALAPYLELVANQILKIVEHTDGFHDAITWAVDAAAKGAGIIANAYHGVEIAIAAVKVMWDTVYLDILKAVEEVVEDIEWWGEAFHNLGQLIRDSLQFMIVSVQNFIAEGTLGFEKFINVIEVGLANALSKTGAALTHIGSAAGASFTTAADELRRTATRLVTDAQKDVDDTKAMVAEASADMRHSWENIVPDKSKLGSQAMKDNIKDMEDAVVAAQANLTKMIDKPWPADAVNNWVAKAKAAIDSVAKEIAKTIDESHTPPGDNPRVLAEKEAAQKSIDYWKQFENQDQILENQRYTREIQALKENFKLVGTNTDVQNATLEAAKARHEANMTQIGKNEAQKQLDWDKRTTDQKLQVAQSFFQNLSSLSNSSNRELAEIGKAAAYANAIVSTAAGIARQFADLPIYLAIPAAAAVAVAGAAQIATISSSSFGGGGSAPSVGVSAPSSSSSSNTGSPSAATPSQSINLNLNGALFGAQQVRDLMNQIGQQIANGVVIKGITVSQ